MTEHTYPRREFVFAQYIKSRTDNDDLLLVKEHLHHKDGSITPNIRYIENYERDFYITAKEFRDHKEKKEYTTLDKLVKYRTTQRNMIPRIQKELNGYASSSYTSLSTINESPYVYDTDITTPVLIHAEYKQREPDLISPATIAVMDYETDMLHGHKDIICGSLTMGSRVHLAIVNSFIAELGNTHEVSQLIREAADKYIGDHITKRNITLTITFHDNPAKCALALLKSAHDWSPDFLVFWNDAFDINKMYSAFDKYRVDPAFAFSDPNVPYKYRSENWYQAPVVKITSAGKQTPVGWADRWNTLRSSAGFYCIDAMVLFKTIRAHKQNRKSYSLDAILSEELNLTKLKFTETDHLTKAEWHREMQRNYKIEYIIYNVFDCISVELLDEHTKDCSHTMRGTIGVSELSKFRSNPKRLADDIRFFMRKKGQIIGSTSGDMVTKIDRMLPPSTDWIITLNPTLVEGIGLPLIKEYPQHETNISVHCSDIDVESAYPMAQKILNISKATRNIEFIRMGKVNSMLARSVGVNMSSVHANAHEIAQTTHRYPSNDKLLHGFMATL